MVKTLNLNDVKFLSLHLVLKDEAQTSIHLTTPTVDLVEKLQQDLPTLQEKLRKGDKDSIELMYKLAADFININRERLKVDSESLRKVYNIELGDLLVFFSAYLDFIAEIKNSKN